MALDEMFAGKVFVTDLGSDQSIKKDGETVSVGRYAVWSPLDGAAGHQIVEVGCDLDKLKNKYGISKDVICTLAI